MKLRVGLIGLGDHWDSRHRPSLKALSAKYDVRAICCEIAAKSASVAAEFDAVPIDGFRAMIERDDIDAILTLAPDWVGPLPIIAACDAGKAVYSSAALDISPAQARDIRQRVVSSGVAFMAEFPRRYAPATIRLKELLATRLGNPRLLFCHQRLPVESQANARRRGEHCPLVWRNLMEQVDWCRYLVNEEPVSVSSAGYKQHGSQSVDAFYQMVSLEFPELTSGGTGAAEVAATNGEECRNGAGLDQPSRPMAQISIGHYIPDRWSEALAYRRPSSIQVSCENGVAFIDLPSTLVWFDDAGQHVERLESEQTVGERMLDHFYRAVTSLIRRTTDLEDAYRALRIVQAADESAHSGRRINLTDRE
ncbi:MAG: Gfo/Idh/MocA family oxidoreductase [Planctomycetota bacterium]